MDDKQSQCKVILFYLKEKGSITTKEARQLCQCERLAERVADLRRSGIPIRTDMKTYINEHGYPVRYAVYRLEETKC